MRYLVGLTAVAVLAVQPVMAAAAEPAKPASPASASRMQNVKLAMLQGNSRQSSQGDENASEQARCRANPNSVINPDGTCSPRPDADGPGQARRTTVLNGLIVAMAGSAAIGGLTIALSKGGKKAVSQ